MDPTLTGKAYNALPYPLVVVKRVLENLWKCPWKSLNPAVTELYLHYTWQINFFHCHRKWRNLITSSCAIWWPQRQDVSEFWHQLALICGQGCTFETLCLGLKTFRNKKGGLSFGLDLHLDKKKSWHFQW